MLKLHVCTVCMRPCKLDANKIQFHELSSHVYTHCENKRGLSHPSAFINDRVNMRRTNKHKTFHVHVETQILLIMKMIFTCLTLNTFRSIAAYSSLARVMMAQAAYMTVPLWSIGEIIVFCFSREDFSPQSREVMARWMTTRIRVGGQKQSQFEPFFASRHRSEINLKLPSCTHSLTPF